MEEWPKRQPAGAGSRSPGAFGLIPGTVGLLHHLSHWLNVLVKEASYGFGNSSADTKSACLIALAQYKDDFPAATISAFIRDETDEHLIAFAKEVLDEG